MKMKLFFVVVLIICLFSCKTREISKKIIKQVDTLHVFKTELKTAPVKTTLHFSKLCDSAGNLRHINYFQNTGKAKIRIKTIRDTLYVYYNLDSIKQIAVEKYKASVKDIKNDNKKIIYKPTKMFWYSICLNILFLLFIFRKPITVLIRSIFLI